METGQGADFTNGHAQGMDMVLHESRKYGFARLLARRVAAVRHGPSWVHVNDVAGFIGPRCSAPGTSWCAAASRTC